MRLFLNSRDPSPFDTSHHQAVGIEYRVYWCQLALQSCNQFWMLPTAPWSRWQQSLLIEWSWTAFLCPEQPTPHLRHIVCLLKNNLNIEAFDDVLRFDFGNQMVGWKRIWPPSITLPVGIFQWQSVTPTLGGFSFSALQGTGAEIHLLAPAIPVQSSKSIGKTVHFLFSFHHQSWELAKRPVPM